MTKIDDLSVSDWIVITDVFDDEDTTQYDNPQGTWVWGQFRPNTVEDVPLNERVGGEPLCILAIGLPFIGVTNGEQRFAIDIRRTAVQKVPDEYGAVMCRINKDVYYDEGSNTFVPSPPSEEENVGEGACWRYAGPASNSESVESGMCYCPRCGEKMAERLFNEQWIKICQNPECRYNPSLEIKIT